jgi:phosphoribosylformylglycinamidine synthase
MCVGIAKKDEIKFARAQFSGASVMLVGAMTGRDGIHGASFASENLSEKSQEKRPSVQVGDPFMEKLLIEACLEAIKIEGVLAVQDLGAAGLTSACSEIASRGNKGIEIDLAFVPQREKGMTPYEIVLSESQERMLLVVKPEYEDEVKQIFQRWDLYSQKIGVITDDGLFTVKMNGKIVAQVPTKALTEKVPVVEMSFEKWVNSGNADVPEPENLQETFLKLLSSENICSRRSVYERYDHRVGINTVVLPGSDAAVLRIKGSSKAIAVTTDCNGFYCFLDPYEGAKIAVAEAARNLVATGAMPVGITDCLNFASPDDPKVAYQLKRAVEGMAEAARFLRIPIVSGNVSLYNESKKRKIYPTPVIGMVGLIEDISYICDAAFKNEGDLVVLIGENFSESACEYTKVIWGIDYGKVPSIDLEVEKRVQQVCLKAIREKIVSSAHDLSEGGLAVSLAESSILGNIGVICDLRANIRRDFVLFGEQQSRMIVTIKKENLPLLKKIAEDNNISICVIGRVAGKKFIISVDGEKVIDLNIDEIREVYYTSLEKRVNE